MLMPSSSFVPLASRRGAAAGRLAQGQAAGIVQGTLIATGSPPFPFPPRSQMEPIEMFSVRPDTWQRRIASN
jgi:hypothetical protein